MNKRESDEQLLQKLKNIISKYDKGKPRPDDEKIIEAWEKVRRIEMQVTKNLIKYVYQKDMFNELNKLKGTNFRKFEQLIFDRWNEGLRKVENQNADYPANKGQAKISTPSDEGSREKATGNLIEPKELVKDLPRKSDITDMQEKVPKPPTEQPVSDSYRFTLKNGMVGQKYSDELAFDNLPVDGKVTDNYEVKIKDFHVGYENYVDLNKIGLELIKGKKLITGTPKVAGKPEENYDFHLEINYETDTQKKGKRELSLKILPDPRTLWKEINPPENSIYNKDHTFKRLIPFQEKEPRSLRHPIGKEIPKILVAASKRGRSHAHKGLFRDDHVTIGHCDDIGWTVIAVADGAGSAKFSRQGSLIACEKSVEIIQSKLEKFGKDLKSYLKDEKILKDILYYVLAETTKDCVKLIEEEAKKNECQLKDFHTTLLLLIYKKIDTKYFIAGFWVGDGALAIYKNSSKIELLGAPDGGEFSGQTKFITMNEIIESKTELMNRIQYRVVDDFTALFAMTDGISDPNFSSDNNLKDISYWDKLWEELQKNVLNSQEPIDQKLLDWLDFWSEGEHDDRTIAILF